jgi:hypothetical protein
LGGSATVYFTLAASSFWISVGSPLLGTSTVVNGTSLVADVESGFFIVPAMRSLPIVALTIWPESSLALKSLYGICVAWIVSGVRMNCWKSHRPRMENTR